MTATRRTLVSASILDADLSSLASECRRALRAGSDRIHLDVMDGHFVPNITFGPGLIKRLRRVGKRPFDAHLMIWEPGRYMDQFLDAGCEFDYVPRRGRRADRADSAEEFARPADRQGWPSSRALRCRPWSPTGSCWTSS